MLFRSVSGWLTTHRPTSDGVAQQEKNHVLRTQHSAFVEQLSPLQIAMDVLLMRFPIPQHRQTDYRPDNPERQRVNVHIHTDITNDDHHQHRRNHMRDKKTMMFHLNVVENEDTQVNHKECEKRKEVDKGGYGFNLPRKSETKTSEGRDVGTD